jgi:hypothetical protein
VELISKSRTSFYSYKASSRLDKNSFRRVVKKLILQKIVPSLVFGKLLITRASNWKYLQNKTAEHGVTIKSWFDSCTGFLRWNVNYTSGHMSSFYVVWSRLPCLSIWLWEQLAVRILQLIIIATFFIVYIESDLYMEERSRRRRICRLLTPVGFTRASPYSK